MDSNIIHLIETPDVELVLKKLILSRNKLNELSEIMLKKFVHLEYLDVSYNYIIAIDLNAIVDPKPLKFMDFSNNELEDVELQNMTSLEVLNLMNNKLKRLKLNDEAFGRALRELRVQNNRLREIEVIKLDSLEVGINLCL